MQRARKWPRRWRISSVSRANKKTVQSPQPAVHSHICRSCAWKPRPKPVNFLSLSPLVSPQVGVYHPRVLARTCARSSHILRFGDQHEQCSVIPGPQKFSESFGRAYAGIAGIGLMPEAPFSEDTDLCIVGPKKGYSPQIGTLVSQMGVHALAGVAFCSGHVAKRSGFLVGRKSEQVWRYALSPGGSRSLLSSQHV